MRKPYSISIFLSLPQRWLTILLPLLFTKVHFLAPNIYLLQLPFVLRLVVGFVEELLLLWCVRCVVSYPCTIALSLLSLWWRWWSHARSLKVHLLDSASNLLSRHFLRHYLNLSCPSISWNAIFEFKVFVDLFVTVSIRAVWLELQLWCGVFSFDVLRQHLFKILYSVEKLKILLLFLE